MSKTTPNTDFIPNHPKSAPSTPEVRSDIKKKDLMQNADEGRVAIISKDISASVMKKINEKFGDNKVVEVLSECMEATKTIAVGGRPMEVPDYKIRLDTAKTVMLYQVGSAINRTEVVTHNIDTLSSLQNKLQKSPALRRAVGNMIADNTDGAIDVHSQNLTNDEIAEATEELQNIPNSQDTEMGKVLHKAIRNELKTKKPNKDIIDKFSQ